MRKLLLGLLFWLSCWPAWAGDVKKEMLTVMDCLCQGGPDAEAAIDWDNLEFKSPALKTDLQSLYSKSNSNEKAGFRKGFLASFAQSFKARNQGLSFSGAARVPGRFVFDTTGARPTISAQGPPGLRVEFRRLGGHLKITKMVL